MTALKANSDESEPVSNTEHEKCVRKQLTTSSGHSERCANPFCKAMIEPLPDGQWRRTRRRTCSDRCKMDVYALRRARDIKNRVGIVRFHDLLEQL